MTVCHEVSDLIRSADVREDAIGRILKASTPLQALLLPEDAPPPSEHDRLACYRRLVNQVHPDRCVDFRAAAAFQRVSLAFDALCAAEAGEVRSSAEETGLSERRWWGAGGATELDQLLCFRTAIAPALEGAWEKGQDARLRLTQCLIDAERVCEHLDRRRGFPRSRLWPSAASKAYVEKEFRWYLVRLIDLLCHLRAVHFYCPLHGGRPCSSRMEIEATSSSAKVNELIERLVTTKASCEDLNKTKSDGDDSSNVADDVDPLDAYMAVVQSQLCELDAKSTLAHETTCDESSKRERSRSRSPVRIDHLGVLREAALPPCLPPSVAARELAAAAATAAARDANSCSKPGHVWAKEPIPTDCAVLRLATGGALSLIAEAERNEHAPDPSLQDQLLGELESDGSEIENDK